jgi:hypothetical protein
MGRPQSRYGRGGEEKNSPPLPGLEPPIIQPVAQRYTTELSLLHTDEKVSLNTLLSIPGKPEITRLLNVIVLYTSPSRLRKVLQPSNFTYV